MPRRNIDSVVPTFPKAPRCAFETYGLSTPSVYEPMVRFLADADLHDAIVTGCLRREPAIDFLSARAAKLEGMSDLDVLALAAGQGGILVTRDFRTMPGHFAEFLAIGATSPGVLLVKRNAPLASVIEDLVLYYRDGIRHEESSHSMEKGSG